MSMSNDTSSYESTTPMPLFPPAMRGGDETPAPVKRDFTARREQAEASLSLLIWISSSSSSSSSSNNSSSASLALSKTPLLREVPQVRRKLTKRDSRGLTSSHPMQPFDADSASAHWSIAATNAASGAAPSGLKSPLGFVGLKGGWLREKPSRTKLASPSVSSDVRKSGWRRATAIFREDGVLSIYGDDHALLQSIHTPSLRANDVRRVDDSLFAMPHVLGIFARPSVFSSTRSAGPVPPTSAGVSASTSSSSTSASHHHQQQHSTSSKDEPIFLAFPNHAKARRWRGLLRTYAIPELYGSHSSLTPTFRAHRQLDLTVFEARFQSQLESGSHDHRSRAGLKKRLKGKEDLTTVTYTNDLSSYPAGAEPTDSLDSLVGGNPASLESVVEGEPSSLAASQVLSPLRSASLDSFSQSTDMADAEQSARNVSGSLSPVADSESEEEELQSGPISGISGAARAAALFDTPGSGSTGTQRKATAESAAGVISSGGPPSSFANTPYCACYCLIRLAGAVVARTKVRGGGTGSIVWVEKFSLSDLPALSALQVDVIASHRAGKYALVGHVDLPLETMRRGEDVEGWFPIWATRKPDELPHVRVKANPSYGREMVGELKMVIRVREEIILHRSKYKEVEKALSAPGSVELVRALSKELDDDRLISYLVDIWTSSLTIVQRLADLADAESSNFGSKLEPELLFRGNTLLSRSLDKFQRLYCSDWLDASIGGIVRRICTERIWLDADDSRAPSSSTSASMSTDSSAPGLSRTLSQNSDDHHHHGSSGGTVEQLKRLSTEVWDSIYVNRHACPYDLRRALNHIRTTVNAKFTHVKPPGPGFQGVGAFVFLRLICPAITTPHLYGLMAVAPDARSARTLMLVAKVFLALANKRPAFDKDKEPWLVQANDFLRTQSAAYEDYITAVSTEPPEDVPNKATPLGDDAKDFALQKVVQSRIARLTTLHRESIPTPTYMLDRPLALASLVSYVVRSSPVRQDVGGGESSHTTAENNEETEEEGQEALMHFLDACCDIEDEAGYYLDRAGYDPKPLEMERDEMPPVGPLRGVLTATSVTAGKVVLGTLPADVRQTESLGGNDVRVSPASRARRATVSVIGAKGQHRSTGGASRFGENSYPSFGEQLPERGGLGPGWSQPDSGDYSEDELRAAYPMQQSSGSGDGSATHISPSTSSRRHSSDIAAKLQRRGTASAASSSQTRRNLTLEDALFDDDDSTSARSGARSRTNRRPLAGDAQVSGSDEDEIGGAFESRAGQFSAQATAKGKRRSKSWWRR